MATAVSGFCLIASSAWLAASTALSWARFICLLAMRDQVCPPTLNLDNPSVESKLDLVPHKAKKRQIRAALSNSFGFGGTNATLVLTAPPQ